MKMKTKRVVSIFVILSLLLNINIFAFAEQSNDTSSVSQVYLDALEEFRDAPYVVEEEIPLTENNVVTLSTTTENEFLPIFNKNSSVLAPGKYESVSLTNGSLNFTYPIISLKGIAGMDLNLALSYNSYDAVYDNNGVVGSPQDYNDSGVALGWSFNTPYCRSQESNASNKIITLPSGEQVNFHKGDINFRDGFNKEICMLDKRPRLDSAKVFIEGVDYADGHYINFDDSTVVYGDKYGNEITYEYYSDGSLHSITDTVGRVIIIDYYSDNVQVRLSNQVIATINLTEKSLSHQNKFSYYDVVSKITNASGDEVSFEYVTKQQTTNANIIGAAVNFVIITEYMTSVTYSTGGKSEFIYGDPSEFTIYYVTVGYSSFRYLNRWPVLAQEVEGTNGVETYEYGYEVGLYTPTASTQYRYNTNVTVLSSSGAITYYTLNAFGDILSTKKLLETGEKLVTSNGYDHWRQPTSVTSYVEVGGTTIDTTKTTQTCTYNHYNSNKYSDRLPREQVDIYGNRTVIEYDDTFNVITSQKLYTPDNVLKLETTNTLTADKKNIAQSSTVSSDNIEQKTVFTYDEKGRVTSETYSETGKGNIVTEYTYDIGNDVSPVPTTVKVKNIQTLNADFNNQTYDKTVEYTYDNMDRILSEKTYKGTDATNAMTTTYVYNPDGSLNKTTAPNGDVTEYSYKLKKGGTGRLDATENSITTTYKFNDGTVYTEKEIYDDFGLVTNKQKLKPNNTFTDYERYVYQDGNLYESYDEHGVKTTYEYDITGRNTKTINADNTYKTTVYDDSNMKVIITYNDEECSFETQYDKYGRVVSEKQPNNAVVTYEYDWMGNVSETTDPLGGVTTNCYDGFGRLTSVTNAENETTLYEYDLLNNVSKMTTNGGSVFEYRYDILNNLIEQIDALGQSEKFAYDVFGRLIKSIDKNGVETSVSYVNKTALPDVITKTKSGVASEGTDFTYNAFGNVTNKKDLLTQKQIGYTYTYDQKPLTVVDNGKTMTYTYDTNNYLHSVTDYFNNVSTYTYNNVGQVIGISRGNDTYQYTYTPRGYLQSETRGGIVTGYEYTNVGLLEKLTNTTVDNSPINSYTYEYDAAGNQTKKTETKGDASIVESYTYDSIGRLESITAGNELTEYLYDANGNRSTQTVTTDGVQNLVIEYDYDLQNRLTEQISQRNGETEHKKYAYDNNGNLYSEMTSVVKADAGLTEHSIVKTGDVAQFPAVKLYRYNLSNQLVSYQDDNGTKATYAYNPDGMRSSKTVNGNTTSYYYNGMYAVNEEQNGELTATNILGANGIIGRTVQGSTGYFVKNGHGDVIQARTTDGTILGNYDYDPWGNSTFADGTWNNPIRYAGEYTDDETGLIYLRARYYDSDIGRFISEDPAKDGLNWYVYCGNNPIAFVDPTGMIKDGDDELDESLQIILNGPKKDGSGGLSLAWNLADTDTERKAISEMADKIRLFDADGINRHMILINSDGAEGAGHTATLLLNTSDQGLLFSFYAENSQALDKGQMRLAFLNATDWNALLYDNKTVNLIASNGTVQSESFNGNIYITVTSVNGENALAEIASLYNNPGKYNLVGRNCDLITCEVALAADIFYDKRTAPKDSFLYTEMYHKNYWLWLYYTSTEY